MTAAAADAILSLLAERGPGKTICPSEAARRLSPVDWRAQMPLVHAAAATLERDGNVVATWRAETVVLNRPIGSPGPYRLRRADPLAGALDASTSDAC